MAQMEEAPTDGGLRNAASTALMDARTQPIVTAPSLSARSHTSSLIRPYAGIRALGFPWKERVYARKAIPVDYWAYCAQLRSQSRARL